MWELMWATLAWDVLWLRHGRSFRAFLRLVTRQLADDAHRRLRDATADGDGNWVFL